MSCESLDQGLAIYVSLASTNQFFTVGVSGVGATKTLSINANAAGVWLFLVKLVDDNTDPNAFTADVPSGLNETTFYLFTETDGTISKDITHSGFSKTWYPIVSCLGIANNSADNALIYT